LVDTLFKNCSQRFRIWPVAEFKAHTCPVTQVIDRSADFCTTKSPTLDKCGVVASIYYSILFLPKDNFNSG